MHHFPWESLTNTDSGGLQRFLRSSRHLSLLCEAEKLLLPGDKGLLAALAGAQRASLNSVSVLQQVVNYLMEPVAYPPVQTVVLCPCGFPFQISFEAWNIKTSQALIFTHSSSSKFIVTCAVRKWVSLFNEILPLLSPQWMHKRCLRTEDKMMTERWNCDGITAVEGAEGPGWHTKHPQPLLTPLRRGAKWSPPWWEGAWKACPLLPHHTTLAAYLFCAIALPHRLARSLTSVWPRYGLLMSGSGGIPLICLWRPVKQ